MVAYYVDLLLPDEKIFPPLLMDNALLVLNCSS